MQVLVGPTKQKFIIDEGILTSRCQIFKEITHDKAREPESHTIYLSEGSPTDFQNYLNLIQLGRIPLRSWLLPPWHRVKNDEVTSLFSMCWGFQDMKAANALSAGLDTMTRQCTWRSPVQIFWFTVHGVVGFFIGGLINVLLSWVASIVMPLLYPHTL